MNTRYEKRCRWGHRAGMAAYLRGVPLTNNPFLDGSCPTCGDDRESMPMHNWWRRGWLAAHKQSRSNDDATS